MATHNPKLEGTHFLNVDLDIHSATSLATLIAAFGKKVFVLHEGRHKRTYSAHLELARVTRTADATIRGFCALIQKLPLPQRRMWNAAKVREFSIGIQAGIQPRSHDIIVETETVRAVAAVDARIVVTIYAPETSPD